MNVHCVSDVNGDLLEKFLLTSSSPNVEDVQFLKNLTSRCAVADPSLYRRSEAFQHILKMKSEKHLSEVLSTLIHFADDESPLLKKDVSLLSANICADAIENIISTAESTFFLNLQMQTELELILHRIKCLAAKNAFHMEHFSHRFFKIVTLPLQVLWLFHRAELMLFTSYIHYNRDDPAVLDCVKSQLVTLLCHLSGDENLEASSIMNSNGTGSIMQEMAKDLISPLLCVAWGPGFLTLGLECCDILNAVLKMSLEKILEKMLDPFYEDKSQNNFLECIISDPLLSGDVMERLLTLLFTTTLEFKPDVSPLTALSKQADWTYNKICSSLISLLKCMMLGIGDAHTLEIIKEMTMRENVNWKLLLFCISVYVKIFPSASNSMKGLVDSFLAKAFQERNKRILLSVFLLARQCCAETCSPAFPSYRIWFGFTFGSHSVWASHPPPHGVQQMLMELLTNLVPHEPPAFLRVHVNKPPCLQGNSSFLVDYNALAKTQLRDLNEAIGFGLFEPEMSTEQDIEHVLNLFEKSGGEVPQTLLDATVFRHLHYEQEFLPKLLAPVQVAGSSLDLKDKLIKKLHSLGKISASAMSRYQQACALEKAKAKIENIVDDVHMEEDDSMQVLNTCLSDLAVAIKLDRPLLKQSLSIFQRVKMALEKISKTDESKKPFLIEELISTNTEGKEVMDLILKWITELHAGLSKEINLQWSVEILKVLQPFRSLKLALLQRLLSWCLPLKEIKVEMIIALVHGVEFLGENFFPKITRGDNTISFATYIAESFPLHTSQEMEQCYRFAVQYMCYAEEHHILQKSSAGLQTVPVDLVRKYRFLRKRYSFADSHMVRSHLVTETRHHFWKDVMQHSKITFNYWCDMELQVHPEKDFLSHKQEYMLDIFSRMSKFSPTDIQPLASYLLHIVLDLNHRNKTYSKTTLENHCCEIFCRDVVNALASLLEKYSLGCKTNASPWLFAEWLSLPGRPPDDAFFFRIAETLPSWLLFTDSVDVVPSQNTVNSMAMFINSRLKNTLIELDRGFLPVSVISYLLNGLCIAAKKSTNAEAHNLLGILLETSPAVLLACKVYKNEVGSVLRKYVRTSTLVDWVLNDRISEVGILQYFGTALQYWQMQKFEITDKSAARWLFFLNVLTLSSILERGDLQLIFDSNGVTINPQHCNAVESYDLLTWLSTQVKCNPEVLEVLEFIDKTTELPYSAFSLDILNSVSAAGLLLLLLFASHHGKDRNMLLNSKDLSTMFCRAYLHCLVMWKMARIPSSGWKDVSVGRRKRRGYLITNAWLLSKSRKLLYSVVQNLVAKHRITLPQEFVYNTKDLFLMSIFQERC